MFQDQKDTPSTPVSETLNAHLSRNIAALFDQALEVHDFAMRLMRDTLASDDLKADANVADSYHAILDKIDKAGRLVSMLRRDIRSIPSDE